MYCQQNSYWRKVSDTIRSTEDPVTTVTLLSCVTITNDCLISKYELQRHIDEKVIVVNSVWPNI